MVEWFNRLIKDDEPYLGRSRIPGPDAGRGRDADCSGKGGLVIGYWGLGRRVKGGWVLSEATSEMSPLPKFEVMGREVRAKGVLSGSNYQWFNRLIKDDEPYRWTGLSVELRRSRRDR
ncbi:MAG: hypothetical protein WCJ23_08315, partial [Verrucomicrobiota bacterium]